MQDDIWDSKENKRGYGPTHGHTRPHSAILVPPQATQGNTIVQTFKPPSKKVLELEIHINHIIKIIIIITQNQEFFFELLTYMYPYFDKIANLISDLFT